MKFAPIVPIPNLGDFESDFHMCLPQLFKHKGYVKFYQERSSAGDFIILDNGAHEKSTVTIADILTLAYGIDASEIVLPDVPSNQRETRFQVNTVLDWLSSSPGRHFLKDELRLMVVPQVEFSDNTTQDWCDELDYMLDLISKYHSLDNERFTIGIPRLYDNPNEHSDYYAMVYHADFRASAFGVQIHLLGWPRGLALPRVIARDDYDTVRSIDAAKPFVYAQRGYIITDILHSPGYPGRPDDFFTTEMKDNKLRVAKINYKTFKDAAEGTDLR